MKKTKIIYWVTTIIIFLWEGLMPALTSHTELAVEGTRSLGYPDYFRVLVTVFKVLGAMALILPIVQARLKEWAYAGFVFVFISASVSHWAVTGFNGLVILPLIFLGILMLSHRSYHQLNEQQQAVAVQL